MCDFYMWNVGRSTFNNQYYKTLNLSLHDPSGQHDSNYYIIHVLKQNCQWFWSC